MSALFKGFATGVLEGTSDFLQREDIRVKKQTDDALKEFTARVEQQRKDRRAYKDKVEDAIGEVVSRGYSLNTASGMIQDFGIPGTINILKNADEAVKFGNATYEEFIKEVKVAKDEASEQTAESLAQNLAATKIPMISESTLGEGMDVRPPLSGSIAGRFLGDTGEENYRDTLLAGLADSLPDQSRGEPSEEFKIRGVEAKKEELTEEDFEPQYSSFSVNRNLMPTDKQIKFAKMSTIEQLEARLVDATDPIEIAKIRDSIERLKGINRSPEEALLYKISITEDDVEKAKLVEQYAQLKSMGIPAAQKEMQFIKDADTAYQIVTKQIRDLFNRVTKQTTLKEGADKLNVERQVTTVTFTINGETTVINTDDPNFSKIEKQYITGRNKKIKEVLSEQYTGKLAKRLEQTMLTSMPVAVPTEGDGDTGDSDRIDLSKVEAVQDAINKAVEANPGRALSGDTIINIPQPGGDVLLPYKDAKDIIKYYQVDPPKEVQEKLTTPYILEAAITAIEANRPKRQGVVKSGPAGLMSRQTGTVTEPMKDALYESLVTQRIPAGKIADILNIALPILYDQSEESITEIKRTQFNNTVNKILGTN
tara:strand:- start:108 stop:1895 length:1788 start_codon:yes stop_codon:yes gene_type:complete